MPEATQSRNYTFASRRLATILATSSCLLACGDDPANGSAPGDVAPSTPPSATPADDAGSGPSATPGEGAGGDASKPAPILAPVIDALASEMKTRSPGTELGLAVYDFQTHEYAGVEDETPHISASSAKAIWVAAALERVGVGPVAPHAEPIFEVSSNDDATEVIKLAGPDYINSFYALAGMKKSAFTQWSGQVATTSPKLLGNNNYITAKDSVSFLRGVQDGALLDVSLTAKLKEWMTWAPRSGFGGWLGTLLPATARASMMHKGGWLPPPYDARCVNEIGLVEAKAGHWYAIAILARAATDYDAEQDFVEHASCAVFKAVAALPDLDCK